MPTLPDTYVGGQTGHLQDHATIAERLQGDYDPDNSGSRTALIAEDSTAAFGAWRLVFGGAMFATFDPVMYLGNNILNGGVKAIASKPASYLAIEADYLGTTEFYFHYEPASGASHDVIRPFFTNIDHTSGLVSTQINIGAHASGEFHVLNGTTGADKAIFGQSIIQLLTTQVYFGGATGDASLLVGQTPASGASASVKLNADDTGSGAIAWQTNNTTKWQWLRAGGAEVLYLHNVTDNVFFIECTPGTLTTGEIAFGTRARFVGRVGFYNTTPIAQQTGVAVSAAGVHAALVNLGLITA